MNNFKVGDRVVCIRPDIPYLVLYGRYTIQSFLIGNELCELLEIKDSWYCYRFILADDFTPLYQALLGII